MTYGIKHQNILDLIFNFKIGFIIEAVFHGLFKVESGFRFVSPFLTLFYIYTTTKKHGWHLDFLTLKSKIRDRWDHLIAIMGFESLLLHHWFIGAFIPFFLDLML